MCRVLPEGCAGKLQLGVGEVSFQGFEPSCLTECENLHMSGNSLFCFFFSYLSITYLNWELKEEQQCRIMQWVGGWGGGGSLIRVQC